MEVQKKYDDDERLNSHSQKLAFSNHNPATTIIFSLQYSKPTHLSSETGADLSILFRVILNKKKVW